MHYWHQKRGGKRGSPRSEGGKARLAISRKGGSLLSTGGIINVTEEKKRRVSIVEKIGIDNKQLLGEGGGGNVRRTSLTATFIYPETPGFIITPRSKEKRNGLERKDLAKKKEGLKFISMPRRTVGCSLEGG